MECPCKNCSDRHIKCHAECEMYKAWAAEKAADKQRLHEYKTKHNYNAHYITSAESREKKRLRDDKSKMLRGFK